MWLVAVARPTQLKAFKMEGRGLCMNMNGNGIIRNYASNENKYSIKVGKKGTITRQI